MPDDLIESLKSQIALLERRNTNLKGEVMRRKDEHKDIKSKYESLQSDHAKATQERDQFKSRAESSPSKDAGEIERLRGENRTFKHKEGIGQLAYSPEVGLNKTVPVDLVMKLIDYKPDTEEFDSQAVKQALAGLKQSVPDLFGGGGNAAGPQAPGQSAAVLNPSVAAVGGALGRGNPPSPFGQSELTNDQMRDPVFMHQYNARVRTGSGK